MRSDPYSSRPPNGSQEGLNRATLDRSESGAPASGHAVRDLFSTDEIFQRLVATADEEFVRSNHLLFWSGLAAGLSISLSFVARAALTAAAPAGTSVLVGNLFYPIGFVLIVLGRYQLFTENTLTPVTLVLTRIASVPMLLRVWGVVLIANVLGAAVSRPGSQRALPDLAAVALRHGGRPAGARLGERPPERPGPRGRRDRHGESAGQASAPRGAGGEGVGSLRGTVREGIREHYGLCIQ